MNFHVTMNTSYEPKLIFLIEKFPDIICVFDFDLRRGPFIDVEYFKLEGVVVHAMNSGDCENAKDCKELE